MADYFLHVRVVEAIGLPATDMETGACDPYCKLKLVNVGEEADTAKRKTQYATSTKEPMWDEQFTFKLREQDFAKGSLIVGVFDEDTMHANDEVGTVQISLNTFKSTNLEEWITLRSSMATDKQSWAEQCAGQIFLKTHLEKKPSTEFNSNQQNTARKALLLINDDEKAELELDDIDIYIGTMNCGNVPPQDDLSSWIPKPIDCELVVVGVQECEYASDCSKLSLDPDGDEAHYGKHLDKHLGKNYKRILYTSLQSSIQDYGNRLYIAAHVDVVDNITDIQYGTESTGIGSVWVNKGGVAISFDYGGTRLCFVNSHLAAHQTSDYAEKRNSDYSEICGGLNGAIGNDKQTLLNQFHHVFWCGDLNYRCNYDPDGAYKIKPKKPTPELYCEMVQMVSTGNFDKIRDTDQLTLYRNDKKCFYGFNEGPLLFPPTFKSERKLNHTYKSQRSPAWCDRVLWRSATGYESDVTQTSYGMSPAIVVSDHKPVYATFNLTTWKRPASIADNIKRTIEFRKCSANNLSEADIGGLSDPMVKFNRQPFLQKSQQGEYIEGDLNPKWDDKQMPSLTLQRNSTQYVNSSLMFFQIRDHDTVKSDDIIAFGSMDMRALLKNESSWTPFKVDLTGVNFTGTQLAGLPAGTFQGEAKLQKKQKKNGLE